MAPIARVRIHRDSNGVFGIPAEVGPVPGPHRVEVHHVSEQIPHTNTGGYSMDDAVRYDTRVIVEAGEDVELPLVSA